MADAQSILSALPTLIAPLIPLFFILIGRIIWNHEKRIRSVEKGKTRLGRTIYGDDKDTRQGGLAKDVENIESSVNKMSDRVEKVESTLNNIENHLSEINGYDKKDEEN